MRGSPHMLHAGAMPAHQSFAQVWVSSQVPLQTVQGFGPIVGSGVCRFNQARLRARQERTIAGVRDGLAEGGGAFGMGFYRGVTGIVTKPLEGAKSRGAYGVPLITTDEPSVLPHAQASRCEAWALQRRCVKMCSTRPHPSSTYSELQASSLL